MTDWTDETLRPLDELARMAFPERSGVTADTLKRRARQGKLIVYRPGKAFLSTLANVRAMIDATRTGSAPKLKETPAVPNALGLTEMELSRLALDRVLQGLDAKKIKERKPAERPNEHAQIMKERRRKRARDMYRKKKEARLKANL
jgi:hypothetical protein